MKYLIIIYIIIITFPLYAQEPGRGTPLGIEQFLLEKEAPGGAAERVQISEQKRQSWVEKQISIMQLAEKKNAFQEKAVANIRKRLKDQAEWNKNYTLQRFIEVTKHAKEIGNTIASYGEHLILQKDGSCIRYYDGRPTDIFNQTERDNYGNYYKVYTMNLVYEDKDQFVADYDTTTTHLLEYVKLVYDPIGAIKYLNFSNAEYLSSIDDRPSEYKTIEGAVEKTPAYELTSPTDTETAKAQYDKIVDEIIPAIESELVYKVTTGYSNIQYYNLSEDTATAANPGGVYGEKKSYDYDLTSTDAPDAPETGTVSNIRYYLFDKKYTTPLDEYWWHAQNASLVYLHHNQEAKEASSDIVSTKLGITKEIDFYDAHYDSYNSLSRYRQTEKISGTEIDTSYYHDITYDEYGRQSSYILEGNNYGLTYTRRYSNIKYDTLSRVTDYDMSEDIDGVTTSYSYWDMTYNNLWQVTDYYYSVNRVEHHRSSITYNSYGLAASYIDVSVENGITTTIYRYNTYNSNGLISEYTEYKLCQSDTVHEFYYIWAGNITYNSIYAITSFDHITIKDTNATAATDYSSKIPAIINALTFDGVSYTLTTIDMIAMGFNSTTTIYTEKWRGISYYSVGESTGSNYYNFTLDTFRGRLKSYSKVLRTTTTTSDTAEVTTL